MAWERIHKTINANGGVSIETGYLKQRIVLGNNADSSTSYLPVPTKSDATILAKFTADLSADTYIQIEHSINGSVWIKQGEFEEDGTVDHDDISKNMAKIAAIDDSLVSEDEGVMMLYDIDTHGAAPYTRFTVKANGQDERLVSVDFWFIPHY